MGKTKRKSKLLFCAAAALLLISLLPLAAFADSFHLTVIPTQVVTEQTFDGKEVNLCLVAQIVDGQYVLEPAFAETGLTIETIFKFDHNKVAMELAEFAAAKSLGIRSVKTVSGKAEFGALEEGLYVVFPAKDQLTAKEPFFVPFLVTVYQEDVTCYPKVIIPPDPTKPTDPSTDPTSSPTTPTAPRPKTGDESDMRPSVILVLLASGVLVYTLRKKEKTS